MRLCFFSLLVGCAAEPIAQMHMQLDSGGGLAPSDVGSVVLLVLDGPRASCMRALEPPSPLDDPELEVVSHALFTVDGTAKHLTLPAERKLVFYVDAFNSPDGRPPHVGRGCSEATLAADRSSGVAITISADQ